MGLAFEITFIVGLIIIIIIEFDSLKALNRISKYIVEMNKICSDFYHPK